MEVNRPNPLVGLNRDVEPNDVSKQASQNRKGANNRSAKISNLEELMRSTPDVREDKVEELRKEIQGGTYNVKAEKIAQKIIRGNPLDEIP